MHTSARVARVCVDRAELSGRRNTAGGAEPFVGTTCRITLSELLESAQLDSVSSRCIAQVHGSADESFRIGHACIEQGVVCWPINCFLACTNGEHLCWCPFFGGGDRFVIARHDAGSLQCGSLSSWFSPVGTGARFRLKSSREETVNAIMLITSRALKTWRPACTHSLTHS